MMQCHAYTYCLLLRMHSYQCVPSNAYYSTGPDCYVHGVTDIVLT